MTIRNPFGARRRLAIASGEFAYCSLRAVEEATGASLERLPFSMRVLLENVLRQEDGDTVTEDDVARLARWSPKAPTQEIPFMPARVLLQDFTGVPVVVDLVAMRTAVHACGGDARRINPILPVDLVIDHSVQIDFSGAADALERNMALEFVRNRERYELLRWAQQAFDNFRVVPPGMGIVHQVNLEYLGRVVEARRIGGEWTLFPDTLVGTDSHTPMINGLGVLGWGVGGIEAEAVLLGQPYAMTAPEVVGVRLSGALAPGTTATDVVLGITQRLRKQGVVGKFVEYFGPGAVCLGVEDRALIANMSPEYGATMGFFPVDERTLDYLRFTGRPEDVVERVERYCKEQGVFRTQDSDDPEYSEIVEYDLGTVEPSLAGPKRPQDRVALREMKSDFRRALRAPTAERGFALSEEALDRKVVVRMNGPEEEIGHGAVVIASITSCTNTSNPSVMVAAGLVARKAAARGLRVKDYVKASLAPGSRVVTDYLEHGGLLRDLEALRFHVVGYGCLTCIGNSGPLPEPVGRAIRQGELVAAAVLSGNRNFEARINPLAKANYLASPPLVVAYALAGTVDIDFEREPLGTDREGKPVYLRDLWPTAEEVAALIGQSLHPEMYCRRYEKIFEGDAAWRAIPVPSGESYAWNSESTYIQEPPYFAGLGDIVAVPVDILGARVLGVFGDSVTTDHISPAGSIAPDSPAGRYLIARGVAPADFNSYGSRRGNHEVMIRGTFANIRIKNLLLPGTEGGLTVHFPTGEKTTIYEAAMRYAREDTPLLVLAGREYGSGSSRDWAAKGTALLGVRAVIAVSYERIHRSNLVGMGVLPLEFPHGETRESLGLTGRENFDIEGLSTLGPRGEVRVTARRETGEEIVFRALARLDSRADVECWAQGGILPMTARKLSG